MATMVLPKVVIIVMNEIRGGGVEKHKTTLFVTEIDRFYISSRE